MQLPNCWVSIAVICIEYVLRVTSGKLYTLYTDSHTWHEVYEVCRSQGQQMLRFKTAEELTVIEFFVEKWRNDKHLKGGKSRDIWIGFCDLDTDSHNVASFNWTDFIDPGEFIKEKTHGKHKLGNENCVLYAHNHKLQKKKCSDELATVCEKETDECASIESSSVTGYNGKYCAKVADLSPNVTENNSTVGMCTVTNGSTSVSSSSTGTTNAAATAPAAAEATTESDVTTSESAVTTTESDVTTSESDVTTSESDVTTVETESASTSEKITSAPSTTTPKATAKTSAASASIATPKSDVTTSESDVTTVKSESAQTPDATTSSNGKTTPVMQLPENLCPNTCTTTNNTCVWLSSAGPSVDEMKELIKKLTLEKKTLSSYKREKTSASDDRPTAQAIGKVGIVFFVLAFAGVVLLDCGRVVDCLRKRNRKRVIFSKA